MIRLGHFAIFCMAVVMATAGFAAHVRETLTLAKGWNAVYLESTPDTSDCDAFFKNVTAVRSVASYVSDAYDEVAQYDSEGREINQKPVSYLVWQRDGGLVNTLKSLVGGGCYLIFADEATTVSFYGTPCPPRFTWRKATAVDGYLNLVAPSLATGATVPANAYFKDGPAGTAAGVWQIGGTGTAPDLLPLGFTKNPRLRAGSAYAMTSTTAADWSGVVGLSGAVEFGTSDVQVSVQLRNAGGTNRTFRLTVVKSEKAGDVDLTSALTRRVQTNILEKAVWTPVAAGVSWELTLDAGCSQEVAFGLDRTQAGVTDPAKTYGAVLVVEDLGGTGMRVRTAISAQPEELATGESGYPAGLWVGEAALTHVSFIADAVDTTRPLPAGGTMKGLLFVHVDADRKAKLLQRFVTSVETNGAVALLQNLAAAPADATTRRFTSIFLDAANPEVPGAGAFLSSDATTFAYTVGETSVTSPFYHAWHPDHDGLSSTFDSKVPSGDNPANYAYPVKPERWSVTNTVSLVWKDAVVSAPEQQVSGTITWRMDGLTKRPIYVKGSFALQRVLKVSTMGGK